MTTQQQAVVTEAKKYLGVPYVWGGKSPSGFDCSGLVEYVYRNAVQMSVPAPTTSQEEYGKDVSLSSLIPGDLLFFGVRRATHHVAIYIGNSQFIHAPQQGDVVKITEMQYYAPSFAKRILPNNIPLTSITLSPASITLTKGETYKLSETINPSNATNQTVSWKTSDSAVATISGGVVTAVNGGTATITATADGKSTTSTVKVNVKASSITLNSTAVGFLPGGSFTLTATVNPSNTTDKTITWTTSDSRIVTVSGGVLKGITIGNATVTVKNAASGISANCSVSVRKSPSAIITRYYQKGLGRTPEAWEVDVKVNKLINGATTWANIAIEFFLGLEYGNKKASNETYVKNLYEALLGRTADTDGLNYYKTFLDNGVSRRCILSLFVKSSEFTNNIQSFNCKLGAVQLTEVRDLYARIAIFVNKHYLGGLKRNADTDGLNYHTKRLAEKTVTAANFAVAILNGTEYKNKKTSNEQFIIDLYAAILLRTPDADGKKYHLGRLTSGTSRTDVMKSFVNSAEYQLICNNYGVSRGTL